MKSSGGSHRRPDDFEVFESQDEQQDPLEIIIWLRSLCD